MTDFTIRDAIARLVELEDLSEAQAAAQDDRSHDGDRRDRWAPDGLRPGAAHDVQERGGDQVHAFGVQRQQAAVEVILAPLARRQREIAEAERFKLFRPCEEAFADDL